MIFKNQKTGETISVYDMLSFISEETEKKWNAKHSDNSWCNLTKDEQNELFCEQFEHEIENDWNLVLLKDLVLEGLKQGLVKIIESPNDGCVACEIGDYWFYFIGSEDENMSPAEVLSSYGLEDLSELIRLVIEDLDVNEKLYYHAYLEENLK